MKRGKYNESDLYGEKASELDEKSFHMINRHANSNDCSNSNEHIRNMDNDMNGFVRHMDSDANGFVRHTHNEANEDDENPGDFKNALVRICKDTSFQGVPYIVASTPFPIRR